MGRLVRDPDVRYLDNEKIRSVVKFTLAVDRKKIGGSSEQKLADFIGCVAFGRQAEFAKEYLRKGTKIAIIGRIQTGSYTNRDGQKVYTTDVVVEEYEFAESRSANSGNNYQAHVSRESNSSDGFMNIPDGIEEEMPFS